MTMEATGTVIAVTIRNETDAPARIVLRVSGLKVVRPPLSCDLAGDRIARAVLRAWARQPWCEAHRNGLIDRMIELRRTEEEMQFAREQRTVLPGHWRGMTRQRRRDAFHAWKNLLVAQFGDFENTLPEEGGPDTPQGG